MRGIHQTEEEKQNTDALMVKICNELGKQVPRHQHRRFVSYGHVFILNMELEWAVALPRDGAYFMHSNKIDTAIYILYIIIIYILYIWRRLFCFGNSSLTKLGPFPGDTKAPWYRRAGGVRGGRLRPKSRAFAFPCRAQGPWILDSDLCSMPVLMVSQC